MTKSCLCLAALTAALCMPASAWATNPPASSRYQPRARAGLIRRPADPNASARRTLGRAVALRRQVLGHHWSLTTGLQAAMGRLENAEGALRGALDNPNASGEQKLEATLAVQQATREVQANLNGTGH